MKIQLMFPHDYEIEVTELSSQLGVLQHYYYPGASTVGGQGGISAKVMPDSGDAWLGTFASGYSSPVVISGIFGCPRPKDVCAISSGKGYIVQVNDPQSWQEVKSFPIADVYQAVDHGLLIFVDFASVVAYAYEGISWRMTDQLWDGIKITEVAENGIHLSVFDVSKQLDIPIVLDLITGKRT